MENIILDGKSLSIKILDKLKIEMAEKKPQKKIAII